jgi:hypothetical protein
MLRIVLSRSMGLCGGMMGRRPDVVTLGLALWRMQTGLILVMKTGVRVLGMALRWLRWRLHRSMRRTIVTEVERGFAETLITRPLRRVRGELAGSGMP